MTTEELLAVIEEVRLQWPAPDVVGFRLDHPETHQPDPRFHIMRLWSHLLALDHPPQLPVVDSLTFIELCEDHAKRGEVWLQFAAALVVAKHAVNNAVIVRGDAMAVETTAAELEHASEISSTEPPPTLPQSETRKVSSGRFCGTDEEANRRVQKAIKEAERETGKTTEREVARRAGLSRGRMRSTEAWQALAALKSSKPKQYPLRDHDGAHVEDLEALIHESNRENAADPSPLDSVKRLVYRDSE